MSEFPGNLELQARVLVTRAAGQSSGLAEALRRLGLAPVLVPAIEICPPEDASALAAALDRLPSFDWLVFTSANAVEAFAAQRNSLGYSLPSKAHPKVAVIGAATARAAGAAGLPVDLLPKSAVAESLTESLLPHVQRPDGRPARILLVRAEDARELLPDTLAAAGAEMTVVAAYRNVVPQSSIGPLRKLLAPGAAGVHAAAFTSSSSVRHLLALCDAAGVSLPQQVLRVSIGPVTSATLREFCLPPHAEAAEAGVDSLAAAVLRALQRNSALK